MKEYKDIEMIDKEGLENSGTWEGIPIGDPIGQIADKLNEVIERLNSLTKHEKTT